MPVAVAAIDWGRSRGAGELVVTLSGKMEMPLRLSSAPPSAANVATRDR